MKNKQLTYLLLVVVGFIYYKLFIRIKDNFIAEDSIAYQSEYEQVNMNQFKKRKTFRLSGEYMDPFLKNSKLGLNNDSIRKIDLLTNPPVKKEKPIVYWPVIKYYGIVKNTNSKKPRALLSVDGVLYKINSNEELFDGLTVRSINREFISISFQKETKNFSLNQQK